MTLTFQTQEKLICSLMGTCYITDLISFLSKETFIFSQTSNKKPSVKISNRLNWIIFCSSYCLKLCCCQWWLCRCKNVPDDILYICVCIFSNEQSLSLSTPLWISINSAFHSLKREKRTNVYSEKADTLNNMGMLPILEAAIKTLSHYCYN